MTATSSDPEIRYVYGRALLDLTDRMHAAGTYRQAAALTDQALDAVDGALERLAEFFEAAGEQALAADSDEGHDLREDFDQAAQTLRSVAEDLHAATERMYALGPSPWSSQARSILRSTPAPQLPALPRRRTR
ncbi:hypothetical protein [Streptomyces sp. bgisy060]|uniref:hypothetical protein n=1 Tax=Streptomyces sp. bgisy060 TaxID=3413775 RepID=UPI003EBA9C68